MRSRFVPATALLGLAGCGLLTQGTTQTVTLKSVPAGAEFQVNGAGPFYRTPHTMDLARQEHTVKFKAMKGYKETDRILRTRTSSTFYWSLLMGVIAGSIDWIAGAWQEFETLEDGATIVLDLEPSAENPEGVVRFSTNPSGASIEIDDIIHPGKTGVYGQGTPVTIFWKDGLREKTVTLKLIGFYDKKVTLRRDMKKVDEQLIPLPENSRVLFESHPPGADVLVNGAKIPGTTPVVGEFTWHVGDTLPRTIEFRKDGYKPDKRWSVKDKSVSKITGLLIVDEKPAAIRVNCTPAGAEIEVDGKRWGEGPADVTLPWSVEKRTFKIRVSRPGYESQELTVEDTKKDVPLEVLLKPALLRLP